MKDFNRELFDKRENYNPQPIDYESIPFSPFELFDNWLSHAMEHETGEANAMVLSTVGNDMMPSSRVVLLKQYSTLGFMFFSNYHSKKGIQIAENNKGSILFFWQKTMRQVRIEGDIFKTEQKISDDYFYSRPPLSRAAALISQQSQVMEDPTIFESMVLNAAGNADNIKRPKEWGGYILKPSLFEFWQGGLHRMHDRILYTPQDQEWIVERLYP